MRLRSLCNGRFSLNYMRSILFGAAVFLTVIASAESDELVSFDLVRESSSSPEARMPYEASTAIRVGDRLELVSAEGYDFGLRVSKTKMSPLGNRIIHASTDGGGKAVIVVDEAGGFLGSITEFGERHQISTSDDGQRRITKESYSGQEKRIDDGGSPPEADMRASQILMDQREEELPSSPFRVMRAEQSSNVIYPTYKTGTARIAVLMYYDESMANPLANIDFITQLANDAFADSGARVSIEIVGTKALDIDDNVSHLDLKSAMQDAEAPFADIANDRSFYSADLVYVVRDTQSPDGEDPCGIASSGVYISRHYRDAYTGLVQTERTDGFFCSELTFAHEIGHNLGGQHNREDLTDDGEKRFGAYSYSHGTKVEGVFKTVMGVNSDIDSPTRRVGLFSSPDLSCDGYPCGKAAGNSASADNVATFNSTGHLIASNEGEFAFEAVSSFAFRGEQSECTTDDDEAGFFRGIGLSNQSPYAIEITSTHYRRPDGSYRIYERDPGEVVIEPGAGTSRGFCDAATDESTMGTIFVEAFHRYKHPTTGKIVEAMAEQFDLGYDGDYRKVRVASGQGGSLSGNPAQSVQIGSSQLFTFTPDDGYALASIQSNCSGRKSGNSYTVDVGQDDCFVEATFNQVAVGETLRLSIETPADGQVYSGIGTFQGWALAQEGIDRVDLYVDGAFFQSAPYGGARGDVGNVFPDVPNSVNSGYALAFNYGNLSDGTHTLRAVAVTDNGRTLESFSSFTVTKFHKPFIGPQDSVNLNGAFCSVQGNQMSVVDALIDGKSYDISLEWRTGTQGFEIYRIR